MDIRELSIAEYAKALRERRFSAVEGVAAYLNAIKKEDGGIHAYLSVFEEEALAAARSVDERLAQGAALSPLAGIPVALKDNLLLRGKKTTAASKILEEYVSAYDASVVKRLVDAGAIILGKTNLDEFAMGASTENSAYGPTKNPHDVSRVPGGSSGGSTAAVAARLALAALGSDTGGSIRQPAAFCGVVGFKPTYGAISRFGLIAMASSLDQIGPVANSVEDVLEIFKCIEGDDEFDATSVGASLNVPGVSEAKKLRLGIPDEYFSDGVSAEVKEAVEGAIEKFKADGFEIKRVSLPHTKYALSTYYIIVPAEVSANLARFDGIRYPKLLHGVNGEGIAFSNLEEKYAAARGYGFGDETKRRILLGTYVLSAGYYDAYYKKAEKVREVISREFEKVFGDVDALLAPTAPTTAFKFGEKTNDPLEMYAADALTIPANLAGLPALSVPLKKYTPGSGELPIGLQIIGKRFKDGEVLALGDYYEKFLRG